MRKSVLCHGTCQYCLCFNCLLCVKPPMSKRSSYSLLLFFACFEGFLLLGIINLLVLQQIEKSSVFLFSAGSFYCFFADLQIVAQWCAPETVAASLFLLDHCVCTSFSLPQEGALQLLNEPTTIVAIVIMLISHLY